MTNVYAAPTADFSTVAEADIANTRMFTLNGRIGRVRWLGYMSAAWLLTSAGSGILGGFMGNNAAVAALLPLLSLGALIVVYIIMCRRRLHDLGTTPWLMIMTVIPFVNLYFFFMMIFKRGDAFSNEYGARPRPNDRAVFWLALAVPIIVIIGIIAAIALPAYSTYTAKAKAAQQTEMAPR